MLATLLAGLALLVALAALASAWAARRGARPGSTGRGHADGPRADEPRPAQAWSNTPVVDGTRVSWDAHNALENQLRGLRDEVRGLADRLADQEQRMAALRRPAAEIGGPTTGSVPPNRDPRARGHDEMEFYPGYSEISLDPGRGSTPAPSSEPALIPTPAHGRPVELKDGALVLSRSLAAVAVLVEDAPGQAQLYVNDQVEIDHMALERWSTFFDFGGGRPYLRYRTEQPAVISWDPAAGRGDLRRPGRARSLSA